MYIVNAQLSLCTDVDQSLYPSTNPFLYCLVVAAPLGQDKKQSSSRSSHVADSVDLQRSNGGVGHGAVNSDSLNEQGVVGRDRARRGQPVAKLVTQSVAQPVRHRERHQEQDRESYREKDREMLARVKEFDADIDIDIGIESKLSKLKFDQEFDQELKDCVEEPRRVSRRARRRESLRESLRMWLRVQVCLRESLRGSFRVWLRTCIQVCLHAERECWAMALGNQLRVDKLPTPVLF